MPTGTTPAIRAPVEDTAQTFVITSEPCMNKFDFAALVGVPLSES